MAKLIRYDLGFNWSTSQDNPFSRMIAEHARRRGLKCLTVLRPDARKVRHQVSNGRVQVGLFLNTQADGSNIESTHMLLCRSLKAAGCMVVEDPDDARIYANRALQLDYLQRAGLPVPRRLAIVDWVPKKPLFSAAQRGKFVGQWLAQPAIGMDRSLRLAGKGRPSSGMLARCGFRPRQGVLIFLDYPLEAGQNRRSRFRVWHFFGHVVVSQYSKDRDAFEFVNANSHAVGLVPRLAELVHKIAHVTGLDWFVTEVITTKRRGSENVLILEPANALAQLGPGVKALADVPDEVMTIAAERLVESAWHHAHGLPIKVGVTIRL